MTVIIIWVDVGMSLDIDIVSRHISVSIRTGCPAALYATQYVSGYLMFFLRNTALNGSTTTHTFPAGDSK